MKTESVLESSSFHFVGIGGIGMCGLAELLHNMGATVTGSDLSQNLQTQRLVEMGVTVTVGHTRENIGDVDVVVFSSAIKKDNEELVEARRRKIPIIRRAEALAEIMRLKKGVAIAGTHGKTTTTSLTANVFIEAGFDPTAVVGGRLDLFKSTAKLGKGEWLIAEADESDGSFQRLSPEMVVITNIDSDHLDHYKTFDNLKDAFLDFAMIIPFYGVAVVCGDDPVIREVFEDFNKRLITYGFGENNDYSMQKVSETSYQVKKEGDVLGTFESSVPGDHNALNSLAAIIMGLEAGASVEDVIRGIETFKGVDRRFQFKGKGKGIQIYDDYGHHPTEVQAVLKGFKDSFPESKVRVLFQPHRYSRTQLCWDDFLTSFSNADSLFVTEIYPAGETPIEGISGPSLTEAIDHPQKMFIDLSHKESVQAFKDSLTEGDILLTLGAGDIYKFGEQLLEELAKS